jgi:ribosomal protein S18 acetylase RimI-like enzyme
LSIRIARPSDLPRYAIIERAAASLYAPWGLDGVLAESTTDTARVAEAIARGELIVATDEADVAIGYALLGIDETDLHLEELAVEPNHGRRGHGTALLAASVAFARARGAARMTLVTLDFVPFGKSFYERRGFALLDAGVLSPRLRELAPPDAGDGRIVMARMLG